MLLIVIQILVVIIFYNPYNRILVARKMNENQRFVNQHDGIGYSIILECLHEAPIHCSYVYSCVTARLDDVINWSLLTANKLSRSLYVSNEMKCAICCHKRLENK